MEISINNKKIHYFKEGSGNVILFVHGWGGSHKSLLTLHESAKATHTSVLVDLPGFGQSDMPEPSWGTQEYADILKSFLIQIECKNCTYIGHSFGGALGVYLASNEPELINKLVLLAPAFRRVKKEYKQIKNPVYKKLKKYLWPLRKAYYKLRYPNSEALLIPQLEENFSKIVSYDLTDLLEKIKQPTLVIWGKNDTLTPISNLEILKQKLPSAKTVIYENAGHGFPIKEPEKTFEDIKKFLEQNK